MVEGTNNAQPMYHDDNNLLSIILYNHFFSMAARQKLGWEGLGTRLTIILLTISLHNQCTSRGDKIPLHSKLLLQGKVFSCRATTLGI